MARKKPIVIDVKPGETDAEAEQRAKQEQDAPLPGEDVVEHASTPRVHECPAPWEHWGVRIAGAQLTFLTVGADMTYSQKRGTARWAPEREGKARLAAAALGNVPDQVQEYAVQLLEQQDAAVAEPGAEDEPTPTAQVELDADAISAHVHQDEQPEPEPRAPEDADGYQQGDVGDAHQEDAPLPGEDVGTARGNERMDVPPPAVRTPPPLDMDPADLDATTLGAQHLVVPLERLRASPSNPRRTFKGMDELADSVRRQGILQPLLVRPTTDGTDELEIVAGERRWRAARTVGLGLVPVVVRRMTDAAALEAQLVENGSREDVHEMEEAEAFERLHSEFSYTVDEIAARVGKSKSHVYARMKLCALGPKVREAFLRGELNASSALLLARIPDEQLQLKALGEITAEDMRGEPMSYRAAASHVQENYMLRLADAPFKPEDPYLVPEAGACGVCPLNTANAPLLFPDVGRATCTAPGCYQRKVQAQVDLVKSKAEASGKVVLPVAEGRKLYGSGSLKWDSPYVELASACTEDKERRTWRKLLGKDAPAVHVAIDAQGRPHELVKRADALQVLKDSGHKFAAKAAAEAAEDAPAPKQTKEEKAAAQLEREIGARAAGEVLAQVVAHVEKKGLDVAALRVLALGLSHLAMPPDQMLVRRGYESEEQLQKAVEKKLDARQLLGLIFEWCTSDWLGMDHPAVSTELRAVSRAFGVDLLAAQKEARAWCTAKAQVQAAEGAEPEEQPAPKKKAAAKKSAAKKKGKAA